MGKISRIRGVLSDVFRLAYALVPPKIVLQGGAIFFALLAPAAAQFTLVSGTVVDPHGLAYANGSITPTLIISGSPRFAATGLPYVPPNQALGLDQFGHFSINLAGAAALIPAGSTWNFLVCSAAGTIPPAGGVGPVCFTVNGITIAGAAQDISAQLQGAALPLSPGGAGGGITGATTNGGLMVTGTTLGLLTNCNSLQVLQWNGTAWVCASIVGGGGGNVSTSGTLTQGVIPMGAGGTNILNSTPQLDLITNPGALTVAGSLVLPASGAAGSLELAGSTTNPTFAANTAGFVGPPSASFPSYALQLPLVTPNGSNTFMSCAPPAGSGVSTCTWAAGGGTSGGVAGSGSVGVLPVWTGTSTLGNSVISASAGGLTFGFPGAVISSSGIAALFNVQSNAACTVTAGAPQPAPKCAGIEEQYGALAGTSGAAAGLFVENISDVAGSNFANTWGGYFRSDAVTNVTQNVGLYGEAAPSLNTTIQDNRGIFGLAGNATGDQMPLNAALVAQTWGTNSVTSSNWGLHILSPQVVGPMTFGTSGGILIEDQTLNANQSALTVTSPYAIETIGPAPAIFGGAVGLSGATNLGTVPATGVVGFLGPPTNGASYFLQLPTAPPTSTNTLLNCTAPAAGVAPCGWSAPGGGSGPPAGVDSINGTGGAFTFTGSAVSCSGTTCTWNYPAFGSVQAGTNTHALVIGNNGSLNYTGTGTINASSIIGLAFPTPLVAGNCMSNDGTVLLWAPCGGGGTSLSSLTPATVANLLTNIGVQTWVWADTGGLVLTQQAGSTALTVGNILTSAQTAPALNITPTWATTGVAQGIFENVTESSNAALGSTLIDVQRNGVSQFNVTRVGAGFFNQNLSVGGTIQSVTATSSLGVCGGNCSANSGSQLGSLLARGTDNSGVTAAGLPGSAALRGGMLTNAAPTAPLEGTTQVLRAYKCAASGACPFGYAMCAYSTNTSTLQETVSACNNTVPTNTPDSSYVGISQGTAGASVIVATAGVAVITLPDGASFLADQICLDGTSATGGLYSCGYATTDSLVGVLVANSGTVIVASGSTQGPQLLTASNVLIHLMYTFVNNPPAVRSVALARHRKAMEVAREAHYRAAHHGAAPPPPSRGAKK